MDAEWWELGLKNWDPEVWEGIEDPHVLRVPSNQLSPPFSIQSLNLILKDTSVRKTDKAAPPCILHLDINSYLQ